MYKYAMKKFGEEKKRGGKRGKDGINITSVSTRNSLRIHCATSSISDLH